MNHNVRKEHACKLERLHVQCTKHIRKFSQKYVLLKILLLLFFAVVHTLHRNNLTPKKISNIMSWAKFHVFYNLQFSTTINYFRHWIFPFLWSIKWLYLLQQYLKYAMMFWVSISELASIPIYVSLQGCAELPPWNRQIFNYRWMSHTLNKFSYAYTFSKRGWSN